MTKKIILSLLLIALTLPVHANNNSIGGKVNAVSMGHEDQFAIHVSFTLYVNSDEMDIQDIELTHYLKDKNNSSIKINKHSNCHYPKEFLKSYRKDKDMSGIIKHGEYDVREIIFWCDNDVKFNAYKILTGSDFERALTNIQRTKSDPTPLSDGKFVMFNAIGNTTITYEDVTHLGDPHTAIMARLEKMIQDVIPALPNGSGPAYNLINQPAPDFTPTMFDKKKPELKMENLKGHVWVMVNFASWCKPCQPFLDSLSKIKKTSSAIWIGVNYDANTDQTLNKIEFKEDMFDYLLHDPDKNIATQYQISGLPFVLIVNKEGIIRYRTFGNSKLDRSMNEMTSVIDFFNQ